MTEDEGAAHAKQLSEYRALEEEYAGQDELPDEIDTWLGVLEAELEKIETQPLIFDQTEIGRAGALVTLDRYGSLAVYGPTHLLQNIQNVCIFCTNGDPDHARASRVQGSRPDAAHK